MNYQELILDHLWLADSCAKRIQLGPGVDRDDVIQESRLALCEAASRWLGKSTFGSYASHWIRGYILARIRKERESNSPIGLAGEDYDLADREDKYEDNFKIIKEILFNLREEDKLLLINHYLDGLTITQLSNKLNLSRTTTHRKLKDSLIQARELTKER